MVVLHLIDPSTKLGLEDLEVGTHKVIVQPQTPLIGIMPHPQADEGLEQLEYWNTVYTQIETHIHIKHMQIFSVLTEIKIDDD
jgi:hypothetical protein